MSGEMFATFGLGKKKFGTYFLKLGSLDVYFLEVYTPKNLHGYPKWWFGKGNSLKKIAIFDIYVRFLEVYHWSTSLLIHFEIDLYWQVLWIHGFTDGFFGPRKAWILIIQAQYITPTEKTNGWNPNMEVCFRFDFPFQMGENLRLEAVSFWGEVCCPQSTSSMFGVLNGWTLQ